MSQHLQKDASPNLDKKILNKSVSPNLDKKIDALLENEDKK